MYNLAAMNYPMARLPVVLAFPPVNTLVHRGRRTKENLRRRAEVKEMSRWRWTPSDSRAQDLGRSPHAQEQSGQDLRRGDRLQALSDCISMGEGLWEVLPVRGADVHTEGAFDSPVAENRPVGTVFSGTPSRSAIGWIQVSSGVGYIAMFSKDRSELQLDPLTRTVAEATGTPKADDASRTRGSRWQASSWEWRADPWADDASSTRGNRWQVSTGRWSEDGHPRKGRPRWR